MIMICIIHLTFFHFAGACLTAQRWHCGPNQDGRHSKKTFLLRSGICYLWRWVFLVFVIYYYFNSFILPLFWILKVSLHKIALKGWLVQIIVCFVCVWIRCEWAVWFWAGRMCSEEQHSPGLEAALHPGGADSGDRLHHAYTRTRSEVSMHLAYSLLNLFIISGTLKPCFCCISGHQGMWISLQTTWSRMSRTESVSVLTTSLKVCHDVL